MLKKEIISHSISYQATGSSRGDIFIENIELIRISSNKEVYILGGGLTPYLHWKATNINRICLNLRQMSLKNYAIFLGGKGGIQRSHWITGGRGGGQDKPKKDRIIFERSLIENHQKKFGVKKCHMFLKTLH